MVQKVANVDPAPTFHFNKNQVDVRTYQEWLLYTIHICRLILRKWKIAYVLHIFLKLHKYLRQNLFKEFC